MQQFNSNIKFITTYLRNEIDSSKVENEIIVKMTIKCQSPLMLWVRIPLRQGVLDTTLCDQGTNKKMEQIIVRSILAINEHQRLLFTVYATI
jgi:hypothetical protein